MHYASLTCEIRPMAVKRGLWVRTQFIARDGYSVFVPKWEIVVFHTLFILKSFFRLIVHFFYLLILLNVSRPWPQWLSALSSHSLTVNNVPKKLWRRKSNWQMHYASVASEIRPMAVKRGVLVRTQFVAQNGYSVFVPKWVIVVFETLFFF